MEVLSLPKRIKTVLRRMVSGRKMEHRLVQRGQIISLQAKGEGPTQTACSLGITPHPAYKWRKRRETSAGQLSSLANEQGGGKELREAIKSVLSDASRSGKPAKFSAEVITQLTALACESPPESGYPISHWTPGELRQELIKREIVSDISIRSAGRFLRGGPSQTPSDRLLVESGH